ncbi:MAG: hypothetical protein U0990_05505 [Candidatus Nanopelagicales bacterium]|nr:hypothetical protein [Candidatus Nanopelagicales bacterium]
MTSTDTKERSVRDIVTRVQRGFETFVSKREVWDAIVKREHKVKWPDELRPYAGGAEYLSPEAERAVQDMVDVLSMNPTVFALQLLEAGERAKKWGRDILLWMARAWEIMDEGRWWDAAVGTGQVQHGVKVTQLCWRDYGDDEAKSVKDKIKRPFPFYLKNTPTLACAWTSYGGEDEISVYEYELPLIDANMQLKKRDGKRPTIESMGKIGWLADAEIPDKSIWDETIKVTVVDSRDTKLTKCTVEGCEHYLRTICVYVSDLGTSGQSDGDYGELVEEYDSPFPGSSFIVTSGRETNETDPHLRYRPVLYPLFVEVERLNFLISLLTMLARLDYSDERAYLALQKDAAQMGVSLPDPQPNGVMTMPRTTVGEMAVLPGEVKAFPQQISEHLMTLIDIQRQNVENAKPNRFILGTNFDEAKFGTGTANVQATQQAALPFNRLLGQSDASILRISNYMAHAVRYWAATGEDQEYPLATTDGMAVAQASTESGEIISVTAQKLSIGYQLQLKTKSETLAEQQAAVLLGKLLFETNQIDQEQYWEIQGVTDIEGQRLRQGVMLAKKELAPDIMQAVKLVFYRMYQAETGIDLSGMGMMMQPQDGQQPPNGGGPPTGGTQGVTGRAINPALAQGPAGGTMVTAR